MLLSLLPVAALILGTVADLTVNTTNGLITGHPASNISTVNEFLGIPFAQPPIGALRFAAPAPYNGSGPFVASDWGYDCPDTPNAASGYPGFTSQAQRVINYFSANSGTTQSEDCLSLNIWTPSNATQGRRLPVLIFLYGGRFTYGHTNTPFFDGQFLANAEHVIVVSANYRDNIFGFPGAPNNTQNVGMRDQRLAVEWISDNIAGFGGNASLLTLFGQSAGAVSIDYWSYAYVDDPIVSGLISESGNALSFPVNTDAVTLSDWYNVSATVGCGASGDTLPCMREVNWTSIKAAAAKAPSASSGNPLRSIPAFYPTPDGVLVFSNYSALSDEGAFAKIPYLLGNNNYEQGYYVLPDYLKGINVTTAQGDDFLLSSFTCPNAFEAGNRLAYSVPVWLYRYFGNWANIELYPATSAYAGQVIGEGSGAYHGAELEMVFGNPSGVSGIPNSAAENEMISLMQGAWAAFARDPVSGLTVYGWPKYDPSAETLILLALNNSPTAEFVSPSLYNAACVNETLG
ncbi:hypothetical protein LTR36_007377 [Oleoguttula mirabilis]|uniref:Carboxylic ester hydrolase n=1 Tax=Oleoguttula mirabilis TaxID=1507867 RepID=A0AAV9JAD1_9PEZI|nr:hypothetical protein LTR36_007377 [Oleoguttula mirabilis]